MGSIRHMLEMWVCSLRADGAGWSLARSCSGLPEPILTTTALVESLEFQFIVGEGPGSDAIGSGLPVLVPDLSASSVRYRWPGLAPVFANAGIGGSFAFPITAGTMAIGTVSVYRHQPGPLTAQQVEDAYGFSHVITALALVPGAEDEGEGELNPEMGDLIANAFHGGHASVYQAVGVLAARHNLPTGDALALLRAQAMADHRRLAEVAAGILDEPGQPSHT